MDAIVLKCPPNGRFHFGVAAPDNDTALSHCSPCFYSDTLFSALIVICSKVFPEEVEHLVTAFNAGEVQISSGQYCVDVFENKEFFKRIYFLPKPAHLDLLNEEIGERKKVRGLKFISKTIWEKGLGPNEWKKEGCYSVDGKYLLHPEDLNPRMGKMIPSFYSIRTEPKIADHVRKKEDNIFFQTDVFLHPTLLTNKALSTMGGFDEKIKQLRVQPHFYFLVSYKEGQERIKNMMELLFEVLVDEGLGGGISTGCGKIETIEKVKDWSLDFKDQKISESQEVSLSLVAMNAKEVSEVKAAHLIVRGGRNIKADESLKRVKMLAPGALLAKGMVGEVVKLHKSQPYLRYGKVFPISISENFELKNHDQPNA